VIFISHQWIVKAEPDPDNLHFRVLVTAVETLCEKEKLDANKVFVWIDYTSIPQRNFTIQALSIDSLPLYASNSAYFIIVAPDVTNPQTGARLSIDSYRARGWCRLEQFARISQRDVAGMYKCEGPDGALSEMKSDVNAFNETIEIFTANYTVKKDRLKLIDTTLGLYFLLLQRAAKGDLSAELTTMMNRAKEDQARIFPTEYFGDMITMMEELALQGDAIFESRYPKVTKARKSIVAYMTNDLNSQRGSGGLGSGGSEASARKAKVAEIFHQAINSAKLKDEALSDTAEAVEVKVEPV